MPVGAARDFQSHLKRGHSFSGSTKSRWPVGTACDFQSHFKRGSIVFQDRLKVDGRFSARLATFSRFSRKKTPIPEQQSNKNLQSRPSNGLMRKHPPSNAQHRTDFVPPKKKPPNASSIRWLSQFLKSIRSRSYRRTTRLVAMAVAVWTDTKYIPGAALLRSRLWLAALAPRRVSLSS